MPENWMEIFKGGKQVDSRGKEHDGDAIIDRAVANFNTGEHEPPIVIGHPKDNSPAFGWIKELKAEAVDGVKRLFAMPDQVQPEFKEMVGKGLFKKRSASFYRDGRLRHVGFLGAMPPAVKGLADVSFNEADEAVVFEFGDWNDRTIARIFRKIKNWMIEKFGQEEADRVIDEWEVESMQEEAMRPQQIETAAPAFTESGPAKEVTVSDEKKFSEAEVNTAKEQAAAAAKEEGRREAAAEFAEQQRKDRATARKAAIKEFCEKGAKDGTIAPAWVDGGLKEFMESLEAEESTDFGEAGGKKSPYAWFTEFLQNMPKLVEFKETAGRDGDVLNGSAGEKLEALIAKKRGEKNIDYSAAFGEVQRENPELAAEYAGEISG